MGGGILNPALRFRGRRALSRRPEWNREPPDYRLAGCPFKGPPKSILSVQLRPTVHSASPRTSGSTLRPGTASHDRGVQGDCRRSGTGRRAGPRSPGTRRALRWRSGHKRGTASALVRYILACAHARTGASPPSHQMSAGIGWPTTCSPYRGPISFQRGISTSIESPSVPGSLRSSAGMPTSS